MLAAARAAFAEQGFRGTTIRAVAAAAGVDPALVHHYFGTKDDLFVAALRDAGRPARGARAGAWPAGRDGAGERLLRTFLSVWDDPELQPGLLALVRALVLEPTARAWCATASSRSWSARCWRASASTGPEVRMPLVASQIIGLIVARYVVALAPLASMPAEDVVAATSRPTHAALPDGRPAL